MVSAISSKQLLGYIVLPAALFLFSYSGGLQWLGKQGTLFFKNYTEAELRKLEASGFINEDGQAEYVVGLNPEMLNSDGAQYLRSFDGIVDVRPTGFSHWYVIVTAQGAADVADSIRDAGKAKFVLQNRGLWLCH